MSASKQLRKQYWKQNNRMSLGNFGGRYRKQRKEFAKGESEPIIPETKTHTFKIKLDLNLGDIAFWLSIGTLIYLALR